MRSLYNYVDITPQTIYSHLECDDKHMYEVLCQASNLTIREIPQAIFRGY